MIGIRHVICKTQIGVLNMSIHTPDKNGYVAIGSVFYYITYNDVKDMIVLFPFPIRGNGGGRFTGC